MSQLSPSLLTPGEVATMFRVDPKTVTRWAASGRITSIRTPGGHRRFPEVEVHALLRGETPAPSVPQPPPAPAPAERLDLPQHSITVEQMGDGDTRLVVVERWEGRLVKICAIDRPGVSLEDVARGYAHTYGATYVPAVNGTRGPVR